MLQQRQIKTYIKTNLLAHIHKQIPTDYDSTHGLLTLSIKFDLLKTFRQATQIAAFIVSNFSAFISIV